MTYSNASDENRLLTAKFHYAIWFKAGRRQVRSWSTTSFEPDSVMEFGREPTSSC